MKKQAKAKLPKVWVAIDLSMEPRFYSSGYFFTSKKEAGKWAVEGGETVHQYAPVQPLRRCVWKPDAEQGWWGLVCDGSYKVTLNQPFNFCHVCGGRIVRRKS